MPTATSAPGRLVPVWVLLVALLAMAALTAGHHPATADGHAHAAPSAATAPSHDATAHDRAPHDPAAHTPAYDAPAHDVPATPAPGPGSLAGAGACALLACCAAVLVAAAAWLLLRTAGRRDPPGDDPAPPTAGPVTALPRPPDRGALCVLRV